MRTGRKGSGSTVDEYRCSRGKICMKKSWSPEAAEGPLPAEAPAAAAVPAPRRPAARRLPLVRLERVPLLERAAGAGALSPESFRKFVTGEGRRCDEGRPRDPASATLRRSFRQAGGQAPERILDDPEELCRGWLPKALVPERDAAAGAAGAAASAPPAAARASPGADAAARETPPDASRRPHPAQEALAVGERRGAAAPTAAKGGARGQGADGRGARAAAAAPAASVPAGAPAQAAPAPPPGRAEAENSFAVKVRQAPDPALQESVAVPFRYSTYDPVLDVNPRLMRAFDAFPYPTRDRALRLARRTRVAVENVQAWFEAQRLKHGISWTPDEVLEARLRLRSSDAVDSDDDVAEADEGGSGWPSGFGAGARTAAATAATTRGDDGRSDPGGRGRRDDAVEGGRAGPRHHAEPTARHAPEAGGGGGGGGGDDGGGDVSHVPERVQVPERPEVLEPGEILDLREVVRRGDAPETQEASLPTHVHMALWASFHESPFPSADRLERLCTETGLTLKTVQQWFEIWRSAGRLPTTSTEGASGAFASNWKPNWSSENSAGLTGVRAERAAPATIDIELGASDVGEDSDSDDNDRRVAEEDEGGTRERAGYASDASDASDPSYRPGNGKKAAAAAAAAAAPAQKQWTLPGHLPCERDMLRMKFEENPWPTEEVVAFLSNVLRMTPLQVRKSFSYRRQQQRKKMMLAEQQQQQQQQEEEEEEGAGRDKRPARDANPRRRPPASASPGAAKGHPPGQASEARKRSPAPAAPGDVATAIARALPLISLNEAFLLERSPSDATLRRLVEQTGLPAQDVVDFFERKRRRSNGAGGGPVAGGPPPPAADFAPERGGPPGHVLSPGQSIELSDEGGGRRLRRHQRRRGRERHGRHRQHRLRHR
uniref:Zinc fingers and homeoboxes protein 1-like n=1 Tax=Petromyzon marinus TaxID=7757 RepID=A0AAJ7UEJ4_PETMA|nr:zinc fingers and homeoboxes protein 1-like [Petromyzon marinus]